MRTQQLALISQRERAKPALGPVTFVDDGKGRVEARLGTQLVGMLELWDVEHAGDHGAFYWLTLPIKGERDECHPAGRRHLARHFLLLRLADWFETAGPLFQNLVEHLRIQADKERRGCDRSL